MITTTKQIKTLFKLLDDWKNLPSYQLERRADIFFALYLPEIINQKFGDNITHEQIIPEFPIKKDDSNLSNKIDYVAVSEKKKMIYFIELKTDENSRRTKQDEYLKNANDKEKMPSLIDNVDAISKKSKSKKKYEILKNRMRSAGMNRNSDNYDRKIVYILPKAGCATDISFDYIIEILQKKNDKLSKRFAESLKNWMV